MKITILIFSFLLSCISFAQEPITLQQCLDLASANSLQLTTENSGVQTAQLNRKYHAFSLLPNLNATAGLNTSFGRRVDPFTNTFATNTVNSQSFGLSSGMTLFNGFRYLNNRKALDYTIAQQELSVQTKQNDLQIRLIETYIELCKQTVQIELAQLRIEKYNQIQAIQLLLIRSGKIASIDTLKSRNSLLNEELLLTKLVSAKRLKILQLNFLMGVPLSTDHSFVLSSVYAITTIPQFAESIELERLAIEAQMNAIQLKTDKATILPTLSLNGNVGTGFSTNNKDYTQVGNPTKSYNDQITQNLYEGIGFYLSVPLFNRGTWFKTKELNRVKVNELTQSKQLVELNLEMRKMEREQQLVTKKAELIQVEQIGVNLQLIYDKTVLLYNEGRTTYTEVEETFLAWQIKLVDLETMKLEIQRLLLFTANKPN